MTWLQVPHARMAYQNAPGLLVDCFGLPKCASSREPTADYRVSPVAGTVHGQVYESQRGRCWLWLASIGSASQGGSELAGSTSSKTLATDWMAVWPGLGCFPSNGHELQPGQTRAAGTCSFAWRYRGWPGLF